MSIWLKRFLFSLVGLLLLAVVGLAIFLLTFNPNSYKSRLEQMVLQRYERTLSINGDIGLSLFPRIGLSVSDVSLSGKSPDETFLSVDSVRMAVAIWPLLSSELVIDHISISGFHANIVRSADGSFNFSDLLAVSQENPSTPDQAPASASFGVPAMGSASDMNIDIAGLELRGGQISFLDLRDGLSTTLVDIEASTGRVTYDQPFDVSLKLGMQSPSPVQDARLQAQALLQLEPELNGFSARKINVQLDGRLGNLDKSQSSLKGSLVYRGNENRFSADGLELLLQGDIVGAHPIKGLRASLAAAQLRLDQDNSELRLSKLVLRAQGRDGGEDMELALDAPSLSISPEIAQAEPVSATLKSSGSDTLAIAMGLEGLSGNASEWQFRALSLDGRLTQGERLLNLKLVSPLEWNMSAGKGSLSAIKGDMELRDRALPDGIYAFPMIGSLRLDMDKGSLDTDLKAVIDGGQAALRLNLPDLSRPDLHFVFNAEKLNLNPWLDVPDAQADGGNAGGKPDTQSPDDTSAAADKDRAAGATPVSMAFIKGKHVQGDIKVGELRVQNMVLENLSAKLQLDNDTLSVPSLKARLYGGNLESRLTATAANQFSLKAGVTRLALEPMLEAASGRKLLAGTLAAQADLKTSGADTLELQQALTGRLSWQVRDGAVHGVDAERTLSEVASALGNLLKGRMDAVDSPFGKNRSTPFSRFDGRLDLQKGQGSVSGLQLVSPIVRLTEGKPARLDLPAQTLDMVLQAQVSARLPKAVAGQLQPLAGAVLPVHISGPWSAPSYAVQWDAVRNQAVRNVVKSGLMELLSGQDPIQQALPDPEPDSAADAGAARRSKDDSVGRIGDALKGLLGR